MKLCGFVLMYGKVNISHSYSIWHGMAVHIIENIIEFRLLTSLYAIR